MAKNDEDRKRNSEPKLIIPPLKKCPFCHGSAEIERGLLDTEDETKKDMPLYAFSVCAQCNAMSCVFDVSDIDISEREKDPVEIMQILVCKAAYAWNRRA